MARKDCPRIQFRRPGYGKSGRLRTPFTKPGVIHPTVGRRVDLPFARIAARGQWGVSRTQRGDVCHVRVICQATTS